MARQHGYAVSVRWTGDRGTGTSLYTAYGRDHLVEAAGKPVLLGSADPSFRGDADRWNPEELLVAALSQCHLLWYLHLAADAGIVVTGYRDDASGVMTEDGDGGEFTEVVLRPVVTISTGDAEQALALHATAHARCYIARSVRFPVRHEPRVERS